MRNFLTTLLLVIFIPVVLLAGLYAWAYYSLPALVTEAHNRELSRSAPTLNLTALTPVQQAQIASSRPLPQATAEALFFFPEGYRANALRSVERRIFALAVKQRLSEAEQLQLYVNHADFGPMNAGITPEKPVIGFAAASQAYFERPVSRLEAEQLQALLDSLQHKSLKSNP